MTTTSLFLTPLLKNDRRTRNVAIVVTLRKDPGTCRRSHSNRLVQQSLMVEKEQQEEGRPSTNNNVNDNRRTQFSSQRRNLIRSCLLASSFVSRGLVVMFPGTAAAAATTGVRVPLGELLYLILRVREATEQESRLIQTGKFKDVQRANIKLAVKFMVENYRLADTLVAASAYIPNTDQRIEAGQVGQNAVQNLLTILEYFDSADVQNLKVGSTTLAGKEQIVLKGLDAARRNIDSFLSYFSEGEIEPARKRVAEENRLNEEEFDPALGVIINLKSSVQRP